MVAALAMLFSCENKLSEVYGDPAEAALPDVQYFNATFDQRDSGILQARIIAPVANQYLGDSGKIIIPERYKVYFYDKEGKENAELEANYGEQAEDQSTIIAKGNVELFSYEDSTTLYTEKLIWKQRLNKIFSPTDIKVVSPDQVIFGDSMVANSDLSDREIFGFRGDFEMKQQENDSITP